MAEQRASYCTRRHRRTSGAEAMHLLVAEARKEAAEGRGVYIPTVLHEGITHTELQRLAVDALVACGFRCYYTPDSRMSPSGWPDIFAVNPAGRCHGAWAIEIKVDDDHLKPKQELWWNDLRDANINVLLLRPEDWQSFLSAIDDGHVQRGRALLKGADPNGTS